MGLTTEVGGQPLTLLPEKAAWLPRHDTLLIADAHIGKAVSFRRLGVPVPQGTTSNTLDRLSQLLARWPAKRVVFLGDFLHSRHAHAPATLGAVTRWRDRHRSLELVLVRGNHDDHAGDPPPDLGVLSVDEPWCLDQLALCHHPAPPSEHGLSSERYVLAGHLHPCVRLSGRAHDQLRLPCFVLGPQVGVLPAFGAFTGMHAVRPTSRERVYAVAGDQVMEVPRD